MTSTVKLKLFYANDIATLETNVNNWIQTAGLLPNQIISFQLNSLNTWGQGGTVAPPPYSFTAAIMYT